MKISRIHRLLRLITLLQSEQIKSSQELAAELGISKRTLFRDLNMLEIAGIPYYHDSQKGFCIARHFFLPPASLTLAETLGLMLLGKAAGARKGWPLRGPAMEAIKKLVATVPQPIRTACRDLTSHVTVDNGPQARNDEDTKRYVTLQQCIDEKRICRIGYKSPVEPQVMHCHLEPYALHFSNRAWYVLGRTDLHQDVRVFKLARFVQVEPLGVRFERPSRFTVEGKLGQAWQLIPEGKIYRIELEFTAKVGTNVSEVLWHPTQKVELLEDGRCLMGFEVDGLNEIAWWICGYADQVKVLKPAKLRRLVQRMHQTALEQYEKGYERPVEVKIEMVSPNARQPAKSST